MIFRLPDKMLVYDCDICVLRFPGYLLLTFFGFSGNCKVEVVPYVMLNM